MSAALDKLQGIIAKRLEELATLCAVSPRKRDDDAIRGACMMLHSLLTDLSAIGGKRAAPCMRTAFARTHEIREALEGDTHSLYRSFSLITDACLRQY